MSESAQITELIEKITEQLVTYSEEKAKILAALQEKKVQINSDTLLAEYPNKIRDIKLGYIKNFSSISNANLYLKAGSNNNPANEMPIKNFSSISSANLYVKNGIYNEANEMPIKNFSSNTTIEMVVT